MQELILKVKNAPGTMIMLNPVALSTLKTLLRQMRAAPVMEDTLLLVPKEMPPLLMQEEMAAIGMMKMTGTAVNTTLMTSRPKTLAALVMVETGSSHVYLTRVLIQEAILASGMLKTMILVETGIQTLS
tara:strand:+ start:157 stop:543 length:387 start_codon:yes stop_codon:yes gene_type:complete